MKQMILVLLVVLAGAGISRAQVPSKAKAAFTEAQALEKQGKLKEALDKIKLATDAYPKYYEAFALAGSIFRKYAMQSDVIFCYRKALEIKPDYCPAYVSFADFYKNVRHNIDSSFLYLDKAVKYNCTDTSKDLNYSLGYYYNEKGKYDSAIIFLKKVLALDNKSKVAINEISYSYRKKENYEEAIRQFREFHKESQLDLCLYYIGMYYVELKQKDKALATLDELKDKKSGMYTGLQKKIDTMK